MIVCKIIPESHSKANVSLLEPYSDTTRKKYKIKRVVPFIND
jgi:hypothetical protein